MIVIQYIFVKLILMLVSMCALKRNVGVLTLSRLCKWEANSGSDQAINTSSQSTHCFRSKEGRGWLIRSGSVCAWESTEEKGSVRVSDSRHGFRRDRLSHLVDKLHFLWLQCATEDQDRLVLLLLLTLKMCSTREVQVRQSPQVPTDTSCDLSFFLHALRLLLEDGTNMTGMTPQ